MDIILDDDVKKEKELFLRVTCYMLYVYVCVRHILCVCMCVLHGVLTPKKNVGQIGTQNALLGSVWDVVVMGVMKIWGR